MIDVLAAAVTTNVGDATLVIVAGSDSGIAVASGVVLSVLQKVRQLSKLGLGRRWHPVILVVGVDNLGVFISSADLVGLVNLGLSEGIEV